MTVLHLAQLAIAGACYLGALSLLVALWGRALDRGDRPDRKEP